MNCPDSPDVMDPIYFFVKKKKEKRGPIEEFPNIYWSTDFCHVSRKENNQHLVLLLLKPKIR